MAEIPESLLRRSAEAKAKALGVPVEQVLAEMKGEAPPPAASGGDAPTGTVPVPGADPTEQQVADDAVEAAETPAEAPGEAEPPTEQPEAIEAGTIPTDSDPAPEPQTGTEVAATDSAVAVETPAETAPNGDGHDGNGSAGDGAARVAASVRARPVAPPTNVPEGVRTQRLLTVVKARAIQNVKAEPQDKVNTWPHLMIAEFTALLLMTAVLIIMSVVLQAPLLEPANFNATPNPSKAPWYFLGLQELLSYFDPQIAGVTVPTLIGLFGFMMIPYVDKNPSTKPSDRKFAIMLYTIFLAGSATLTIIGVLFRGQGFNFAYPWVDGVFFDDLKDWVNFE